MRTKRNLIVLLAALPAAGTFSSAALADADCSAIPRHAQVRHELWVSVSRVRDLGVGLGNDMWATIVNRDGQVCVVAHSGKHRGRQWLGSRVISAQKANTANAFSLKGVYPNVRSVGRALASGNLYGLVQPGGSLFGLQFSNPVDTAVAYGGERRTPDGDAAERYGTPADPMVGNYIGGINVFGGGLALYNPDGDLIGGLGVSGDTSCADHIIAWILRNRLDLDSIPGGVANGTDNLILADPPMPNTFQHPVCGFGEEAVIENLPRTDQPE